MSIYQPSHETAANRAIPPPNPETVPLIWRKQMVDYLSLAATLVLVTIFMVLAIFLAFIQNDGTSKPETVSPVYQGRAFTHNMNCEKEGIFIDLIDNETV